jgi:hypothetical protein
MKPMAIDSKRESAGLLSARLPVVLLSSALLVGCAQIVGIGDLGPDGGAGSGSGGGNSSGAGPGNSSGGRPPSGSSSGGNGGSSSGSGTGSSSGAPPLGTGDFVGTWTFTGTDTQTCGSNTATASGSGSKDILAGPAANQVHVTISGTCVLTYTVTGNMAQLDGTPSCTGTAANGNTVLVQYQSSVATLNSPTTMALQLNFTETDETVGGTCSVVENDTFTK